MIKKFKNFIKEAYNDIGLGPQYLKNKGIGFEDDIAKFNELPLH